MALLSNASFFLSATNPTSSSSSAAEAQPDPSAANTLGAGEEMYKRVLMTLSQEPMTAERLAERLGVTLAEVESAVVYLRDAGMVEDKSGGPLELSPFAQDALKILAL